MDYEPHKFRLCLFTLSPSLPRPYISSTSSQIFKKDFTSLSLLWKFVRFWCYFAAAHGVSPPHSPPPPPPPLPPPRNVATSSYWDPWIFHCNAIFLRAGKNLVTPYWLLIIFIVSVVYNYRGHMFTSALPLYQPWCSLKQKQPLWGAPLLVLLLTFLLLISPHPFFLYFFQRFCSDL